MFITKEPIGLSEWITKPTDPACGAVVLFAGMVRNHHVGKAVQYLIYTCYEAMAVRQFQKITEDLVKTYPIASVRILHRVGRLEIGELAIVIEVLAAHRDEAYRASRETIERIKRTVPIWKQEFYQDGSSTWVLCSHPHEGGV